MKHYQVIRYFFMVGAILTATLAFGADHSPLTLGILPLFNAGDDAFAPAFGQHLALKLFQQLQSEAGHAVLLNPGGIYNPSDDEWLLDYGKKGSADFLVITTLLKMDIPEKGDCIIAVQTEIMDLKTGSRLGPWKSAVQINKRNARLDYAGHATLFGGYELGSSRVFENQPLGKAMLAIADQVTSQVLSATSPGVASGAGQRSQEKSSAACDINLKLLYTSKHAASKSYTLFADGRDETLGVKDGIVLLRQKSGTILLQWSVNDAPYKLPKQELYQATTNVDCSKSERQLTIELGAAGEAFLVWK